MSTCSIQKQFKKRERNDLKLNINFFLYYSSFILTDTYIQEKRI